MRSILITGGAGFIGSNLVSELIKEGIWNVTSIDNFDSFYSKRIKKENIKNHFQNKNFTFKEIDICNLKSLYNELNETFDVIIHLAAKAGVRPSIENPTIYHRVNIEGTQNLLEFAKNKNINHFIFISSSSVYGINPNYPWKEGDIDLKPISPYASTKISCELLCNTYSHLYGIRFVILRLFTVYGPRQRPDLAIYKFTRNILNNNPIQIYGNGDTLRDYTYIDDIISGIRASIDYNNTNFEVFNLGNQKGIQLKNLIDNIEEVFEKKAIKEYLPEQPGDVPVTKADISKAQELLYYNPSMQLKEGLKIFKEWFLKNHR